MTRAVVNVATGARYLRGQARLEAAIQGFDGRRPAFGAGAGFYPWGAIGWYGAKNPDGHGWEIPKEWPTHSANPYAFKAYALQVASTSHDLLLWADASILPIRSLEPIWERIEREGYLIWDNGYSNAEWCCDSWYADCFPGVPLEEARAINQGVRHVVATCFGVNVRHQTGYGILSEYFRLASETMAFCGPWWNANSPQDSKRIGAAPCGPPSVRGHRHDQSSLSLIAHQMGLQLMGPPDGLAYRGRETDETILVVDGGF